MTAERQEWVAAPFVQTNGIRVNRVALVCMPWGCVTKPSIAMGLLKNCAKRAGFATDVHFLNLLFAKRIGLKLYERIAEHSSAITEWFFSQALFGPNGSGELIATWEQVADDHAGLELMKELADTSENVEAECTAIAERHVSAFITEALNFTDWSRYGVVGFTSTFAQSMASLLLAKELKMRYPTMQIIFGGANLESDMGVELLRGFEWVDYVVHSEAEETFPMILRNLDDGIVEPIPGVSIRMPDGGIADGSRDRRPLTDLNETPIPDYSEYFDLLKKTGLDRKFHPRIFFESSRGCWWGAKHHCTFCGLNGTTMAYRKKRADRVLNEILELSSTYRSHLFAAADNILPMEFFRELMPQIIERDLDLDLFYEIKANLSKEQLQILAKAGIRAVQPGIESLTTRVLEIMRKGSTVLHNAQILKWCQELGIAVNWNLLYRFPRETPADYENVPSICRMLSHCSPPVGVGRIVFERFSPYHEQPQQFNLTLKPASYYSLIYPGRRVTYDRIAYCFESDFECEAETYIAPVRETVNQWREVWRAFPVSCTYRKGPNFVTIVDNRPLGGGAAPKKREVTLGDWMAKIFLFCDVNRSYRAIWEMISGDYNGKVHENEIKLGLSTLVEQGLMLHDGGRYLSLPTREGGRVAQITQGQPAVTEAPELLPILDLRQ
ncbi:MAG: RiPP maturation radical SAM C-methyltransferase [Silvibacterium sp.]|jgi:ribosomal peptide maturation radical SAM protein 1